MLLTLPEVHMGLFSSLPPESVPTPPADAPVIVEPVALTAEGTAPVDTTVEPLRVSIAERLAACGQSGIAASFAEFCGKVLP